VQRVRDELERADARILAHLARSAPRPPMLRGTPIDPNDPLASLLWQRAMLQKRQAALDRAIDTNHAVRRGIEEGPGTRAPDTPAEPQPLELVPGQADRPGLVESGTLPDGQRGRVGFDLGPVAGRTDPGHQDVRNLDAMAAAVHAGNGRIVAVVADQQGALAGSAATPLSTTVVTVAMETALAQHPDMPVAQVAAMAFAAARGAAATSDASTTFLLVVASPLGPDTTRVAFTWVGDSRGYLVSPAARTEQVTVDHTWSTAQRDEENPVADPVQYSTTWLGRNATFESGVHVRDVTGSAVIVLTTDELHDFYPDAAELGAVVGAAPEPGRAADDLIDAVYDRGSGNKTAVVIRLRGGAQPLAEEAGRNSGKAVSTSTAICPSTTRECW
jgi:serine/threonine protein phosphatase PrpC